RELYHREALARAQLEQATAELEAARKRQTELTSVIAHELAAPLTTLRGYAELLTRSTTNEGVRDRARAILIAETSRMERLVQDLVTDAGAPTGIASLQLEPCDLAAVVREQVEVVSRRSQRHSVALVGPNHLNV